MKNDVYAIHFPTEIGLKQNVSFRFCLNKGIHLDFPLKWRIIAIWKYDNRNWSYKLTIFSKNKSKLFVAYRHRQWVIWPMWTSVKCSFLHECSWIFLVIIYIVKYLQEVSTSTVLCKSWQYSFWKVNC